MYPPPLLVSMEDVLLLGAEFDTRCRPLQVFKL